jgi:hypothetical protein
MNSHKYFKYEKANPIQAWRDPLGSRRVRLPELPDNLHMKVARLCHPYAPAAFTPRRYFMYKDY